MLRMSCKAGLRCFNAYLGWRKLPEAIGQLGLEGPEANLRKRCWRANTTRGKVISSRNQLFIEGKRFAVQSPDDLQAEAAFGERSETCGPKQNYFFQLVVQFSEKTQVSLICWGWRLLMSQNFLKMVHLSSRSKIWRLSWAKFSKLFCGGIWKEIIWEITWEGI